MALMTLPYHAKASPGSIDIASVACCSCILRQGRRGGKQLFEHSTSISRSIWLASNIKCHRRKLIDVLRYQSPAQLAAGSISAPSVAQIVSAFKVIMGRDGSTRGVEKIQQLRDNANYMRERLRAYGCHVLGDFDSPVLVSRNFCSYADAILIWQITHGPNYAGSRVL